MRRLGYGIAALCMAFAFSACSDDSGDPPKKDTGAEADKGPGSDAKPDIMLPEAGTDGPANEFKCDKNFVGKPCTAQGDTVTGCGDQTTNGMTCITTGDGKGFCACANCTPDDTNTPLVNENNCPDPTVNICAPIELSNGTANMCFRTCKPKIGASDCDAPLICHPRSGSVVGLFDSAVCLFSGGCTADKDCPVITQKACKTDGSVACDAGDECIPLQEGGADGLCAKPGKCDTTSGLCAPRTTNAKADAKVGDPCKDDTECAGNMRCEREIDTSTVQKAGGEACVENSDCCSGTCTASKCEPGLCTIHARNGYCLITNCMFPSLTDYQCPTGSTCNKLFTGGLCMKTCSHGDAATCRGNANDKLGDYECRGWNNISFGSIGAAADAAVCDFGDQLACNTIPNLDCNTWGEGQQNPTNMNCRDLQGTVLTNAKDPMGLCLDDTASGPAATN